VLLLLRTTTAAAAANALRVAAPLVTGRTATSKRGFSSLSRPPPPPPPPRGSFLPADPRFRTSSAELRFPRRRTTPSSMSDSASAAARDDVDDGGGGARFGQFRIPSGSIFYKSGGGDNNSSSGNKCRTYAFVNLRPIVPGHVLVAPERVAPRLSDLTDEEHADLWATVRVVQDVLRKRYGSGGGQEGREDGDDSLGFNVAVQDGKAAGQSVPHVHVHVLPRREGDLERNDDVYRELEEWAPRADLEAKVMRLEVADDEDRKDRTSEQMEAEAASYRALLSADRQLQQRRRGGGEKPSLNK